MKSRTWREVATERMSEPKVAAAYLRLALEDYDKDGDTGALLISLRTVVEARGGIGALAKATGLSRQTLYRTLAGQHSPRLDTLAAILHFCGVAMSTNPSKSMSPSSARAAG